MLENSFSASVPVELEELSVTGILLELNIGCILFKDVRSVISDGCCNHRNTSCKRPLVRLPFSPEKEYLQ